jgi:hypothetical protein
MRLDLVTRIGDLICWNTTYRTTKAMQVDASFRRVRLYASATRLALKPLIMCLNLIFRNTFNRTTLLYTLKSYNSLFYNYIKLLYVLSTDLNYCHH